MRSHMFLKEKLEDGVFMKLKAWFMWQMKGHKITHCIQTILIPYSKNQVSYDAPKVSGSQRLGAAQA